MANYVDRKIPDDKRPTCTCGAKMKIVEYRGYYDSFKFFECDACTLVSELDRYNPDKHEYGPYA